MLIMVALCMLCTGSKRHPPHTLHTLPHTSLINHFRLLSSPLFRYFCTPTLCKPSFIVLFHDSGGCFGRIKLSLQTFPLASLAGMFLLLVRDSSF